MGIEICVNAMYQINGKKLLSGCTRCLFLLPHIQPFEVLEGGSSQPVIMFRAITDPTYEVLNTVATTPGVKYFLYVELFLTVWCEDR